MTMRWTYAPRRDEAPIDRLLGSTLERGSADTARSVVNGPFPRKHELMQAHAPGRSETVEVGGQLSLYADGEFDMTANLS